MFNDLIPYSDIHELNLDWIIKKVREYIDISNKLEIDFDDLKTYVYSKINELETYMNDYFDNLDIQTEINNKLDEMYESGQLSDIIQQYLEISSLLSFNTIADMKNANNFINGSDALTLGKLNYLDGEIALFKIRTLTSSDVIDEENIFALTNYPTLIAEKIPLKEVENTYPRRPYFKPEDYGAVVNDESIDNAPFIKNAIDDAVLNDGIVLLSFGTYHTQTPILITSHPYGLQILGVGASGRIITETKGTEIFYHGNDKAISFSNGLHSSLLKDFTIRCDNQNATCIELTNEDDSTHIARTTMTNFENMRFVYTKCGVYTTNAAYFRLIYCDFSALSRIENQKALAVINTYTNNEYLYMDNVVIDGYACANYGNSLSTCGIYFERMTHVMMNNVDITDCDYAMYLNAHYEISFVNINTLDIARCRKGIYGTIQSNVINNFHCEQLVYTAPNDPGADDRVILMNKTGGGAAYSCRMVIDNIIVRTGINEMDYWVEGTGDTPFGSGVTKFNFRNNQNPKVNYGDYMLQMDSSLSTTAQLTTSSVDYNDIKYSGLYPQTLSPSCTNSPGFNAILFVVANHLKVVQIAISLDVSHTMMRRIYTSSTDTWSAWSNDF